MANGDYLRFEELQELIVPITKIKEKVDLFVKERNLEIIYYSRGWPHFEITWENSYGVDCLIQLYLDDDKEHYVLWIAGTIDFENKRYMKDVKLDENIKTPFDVNFIISEMEKGYKLCNLWKFEDLEE